MNFEVVRVKKDFAICVCLALYIYVRPAAAEVSAAVVVAAADSLEEEKSRADIVCDGQDDQVELADSLARARRRKTQIDIDPKTQMMVECALNHAVEWLPGTYNLSAGLEIPDAANCVIRAEGTTLRYQRQEGDAVVIRGMNRCRYAFGTIESGSTGAALRIQPRHGMPPPYEFCRLRRPDRQRPAGHGIDARPNQRERVRQPPRRHRYSGFDKGVLVGDTGSREKSASTQGKCDTNWFWLSYVRMCQTCIEEGSQGVDCSMWEVNVDASVPDGVAIRAGGAYGKWYVIMGTFTFEKKNKAVVLEPGAKQCVFEVHPPLENFAWEDNSGNSTNTVRGPQVVAIAAIASC